MHTKKVVEKYLRKKVSSWFWATSILMVITALGIKVDFLPYMKQVVPVALEVLRGHSEIGQSSFRLYKLEPPRATARATVFVSDADSALPLRFDCPNLNSIPCMTSSAEAYSVRMPDSALQCDVQLQPGRMLLVVTNESIRTDIPETPVKIVSKFASDKAMFTTTVGFLLFALSGSYIFHTRNRTRIPEASGDSDDSGY